MKVYSLLIAGQDVKVLSSVTRVTKWLVEHRAKKLYAGKVDPASTLGEIRVTLLDRPVSMWRCRLDGFEAEYDVKVTAHDMGWKRGPRARMMIAEAGPLRRDGNSVAGVTPEAVAAALGKTTGIEEGWSTIHTSKGRVRAVWGTHFAHVEHDVREWLREGETVAEMAKGCV